jgi:exodeoxyribonuclease-3
MLFTVRPIHVFVLIALAVGYFGTRQYQCQFSEEKVAALQHELTVLEGEIIQLREQVAGKQSNIDAAVSDKALLGGRWTQKKLKQMVEVMPKWEEPEFSDTAGLEGLVTKGTLKVVSFNILEGGRGRIGKISHWIHKMKPDVVGLSECNGFTELSLKNLALRWGHNYTVLGEAKSGYHVALTSKFPIEEVVVDNKTFLHCAVSGLINGFRFLTTHLRPNDPEKRLAEANEIEIKGTSVIMGDFNSLSPLDQKVYQASHLEHIAKGTGHQGKDAKLKKKFAFEGALDYRVMSLLTSKGFHDLVQEANQGFIASVPTKLNQNLDKMNTDHDMRLDYILASLDVAPRGCTIWKDKHTDNLSDHYPIVCEVEKFVKE